MFLGLLGVKFTEARTPDHVMFPMAFLPKLGGNFPSVLL